MLSQKSFKESKLVNLFDSHYLKTKSPDHPTPSSTSPFSNDLDRMAVVYMSDKWKQIPLLLEHLNKVVTQNPKIYILPVHVEDFKDHIRTCVDPFVILLLHNKVNGTLTLASGYTMEHLFLDLKRWGLSL